MPQRVTVVDVQIQNTEAENDDSSDRNRNRRKYRYNSVRDDDGKCNERSTLSSGTKWFEINLNSIVANGSIRKSLFTIAVRNIEGFGDNLFNIFDTNHRGSLSVQELVGGFGLLMEEEKRKGNRIVLKWFNEHFEQICDEEYNISRDQFLDGLKSDTFVSYLFTVFDLDGNGEIQMKEFIRSLDRLECASVDRKWYRWIEDHFDIDRSENRKITFKQFKKALHLKQSFFSERFFAMFDTDANGLIDMHELVDGLQILTKGTETEKLQFLFDVYDIDGNGSLNKEEIKVVLQSCVEESNIKFSEEQMQELVEVFFEETDLDHDNQITFQEFSSFLSKYPGVAENLTITAGNWLNPPSKTSMRHHKNRPLLKVQWDYVKKNPSTVLFVTLYFCLNAALFTWVAVERRNEGVWVIVARTNGMCLNFNCVLILVLMMKSSLTWLRSTRVGKYLPIDHHIEFHKSVAVVILTQSVLHFIGHLGRYIETKGEVEVWEYLFTTKGGEGWLHDTAGITGVLLFIILGIITLVSLPFVRRNGHFELFYFTHHLFLVWWTLLIFHAPNFWKWFIGPALVYLIERILHLRVVNTARFGKTFIKEGIILPSNVTHLIIPRPQNFSYRPGDYVLVNIPRIAKYEWHPFTISSSPDQTETIWLHIRVAGTWTRKLYDYYNEESKTKEIHASKRRRKRTLGDLMEEERMDQIRLRNRSLYNPIIKQSCVSGTNNNIEDIPGEAQRKDSYGQANRLYGSPPSMILKTSRIADANHEEISKLEIYLDGPYGSPSEHFFEAEHAVLISCGIGVTPFASILQTIMLRYKNASHICPSCEYSWVGNIPFSLRKLQKVDFFWINRDQASFEWFLSLLSQLEIEQSEQRGVLSEHFLDIHVYMTSALKKEDMKALGLQLALELIHEKKEKDLITGLRTRTKPGRPNWNEIFKELKDSNHGKVSVFYCGNPALGNVLKLQCQKHQFQFRSEKF